MAVHFLWKQEFRVWFPGRTAFFTIGKNIHNVNHYRDENENRYK